MSRAESIASVPLEAGDSVYVPVRLGYVRVSGLVANPGAFPFTEGKPARWYVDLAGGFLEGADRERLGIFGSVSGITAPGAPSSAVRDGDEIIVSAEEGRR